jgi:type IV pilus assembly protein PilY1
MTTGTGPFSRRATRLAAALLAAAALAVPGPGRAAQMSFPSGSLIIPASIEYQSNNGTIGTYALVYAVLSANAQRTQPIKFYWAIAPNKLSPYRCDTMHNDPSTDAPRYDSFNDNDGCDFSIVRTTANGGQPVSLVDETGNPVAPFQVNNLTYDSALGPQRVSPMHTIGSTTQMVKYLGGSWIVHSSDAQAFLELVSDATNKLAPFHAVGTNQTNNNNRTSLYVNIHVANADFTAPVASVLKQAPPKIAVVGSAGQTNKLVDVLANAGLCGTSGFFATTTGTDGCPGTVYDDYTSSPSTLLGSSATSANALNNVDPTMPIYGLLWFGDGAFGNNTNNSSIPSYQRATIEAFLSNKGNLFAEYNSIGAVEGGFYQSTGGVNNVTSADSVAPNEDCNDSSSFSFFTGGGGSCVIYKGVNLPFAQAGNFYYQMGGNGNWQGYTGTFRPPSGSNPGTIPIVQEGPTPGNMIASTSYYQGDTAKGLLMYLAGHKYDNPPKYWGERVILNTIFARLYPPTGTELSRSEPVAYVNTNAAVTSSAYQRVYQGTYVEQLLPDVTAMVTYDATNPTVWLFPFMNGHLYQYDLSTLDTTAQKFNFSAQATTPDAGYLLQDGTPRPPNRHIWTYVDPRADTTGPAPSGAIGWKRIDFKYTEVTSGCTAGSDGVCQLSKALLASGNAAGIQLSALASPASSATQAQTLGMLVSQIRGSCAALHTGTPVYSPADVDCDPRASSDTSLPPLNRARLGGIDHGSPAVVGPSRYVTSAPWNQRPVVAYAGGHDGMIHAFYVSDWDGGTARSWPGATNVTNIGLLTGVVPMQELWAIMPPGQVGQAWTNNALVDGSINVVDVFADFPIDANGDGVIDWSTTAERPTGQRSWRTVLIATAGKGSSQYGIGGSEMFALDVTNPLSPVLLWHLGGATENDGRAYNKSSNSWAAFDAGGVPSDPTQYALKWSDSSTINYNVTDQASLDALKTGRYDYRNFGQAYSTAVAKIWSGAGYQYALFVATSAADFGSGSSSLFSNPWYSSALAPSGVRGVEVYAIDLVTGQKIWQWEHLYSSTLGPGVDNSVPPRMALGDLDANGSTERIYVGDLEGHLWELSSSDGRNWNYLLGKDNTRYSLPLFGTPAMTGGSASSTVKNAFKLSPSSSTLSQQPLTTPIGQGRFTQVPTDQQPYLLNRLAVLVGTMGVDWTIAPYEAGHIFVLPVSPDMGTRLVEPIDVVSLSSEGHDPRKFGILLPYPPGRSDQPTKHAWWDVPLGTGERVYGMPRVANNQIVFNTAFGSFTGDISMTISDPGKFWSVSATTSGGVNASSSANDSKSFAGVVIVGNTVVVTTDDKIKRIPNQVTAGDVNTSPFNRSTPAAPKSWETWLEVRQ